MPHEFLSEFLSTLQDAGELARIAAPVESGLEIAAITDQVSKAPGGGPALLFSNVKNSSIPVATNLLGSRRRLCLALGVESVDDLSDRWKRLLTPDSSSWLGTLRRPASAAGTSKLAPRVIRTAVCQQVVKLGRDVNLWDLPIPRCWPAEANPVITAGMVMTQDLSTGARSVARLPVQVGSQTQLIPHWNRYHDAHDHWQQAVRQQKQFPVAIGLGGNPVLSLLTATPLASADPLLFGGFLCGASLDLVRARSVELDVLAASEIILEGYIDYAAEPVEAPQIASGTGHYLPTERLPVIQVTAITHRANPVLPVIVPGPPPCEESWLDLALERLSLEVLKSTVPEVVDIHQPVSGAGRNLLFVSIRKQHPLQARQVLNGIWGSRLLGLKKTIVVVDDDVDVKSEHAVWFAVGGNMDPGRDVIVTEGPLSMDDQAIRSPGVGHKLGIDATRKFPEESCGRATPTRLAMPDELISRLRDRWGELGLPVEKGVWNFGGT